MSTRLNYNSEFLDNVNILIIFSEDHLYKEVSNLFRKYGYGFMVPNKNLIIIDGEILLENYTSSFLKFIEAHEVAHIVLGHDKDRNDEDEINADYGAYIILKQHGKEDSLSLLLDNFEDRHGVEFDYDEMEKLKKYF